MSIFIVGNKKDLIDLREVTTEEAGAFAAQNKLFFLETSALDNSDRMIEKVFMTLSQDIIKNKDKAEEADIDTPMNAKGKSGGKQMELREVNDGKIGQEKKKGCC